MVEGQLLEADVGRGPTLDEILEALRERNGGDVRPIAHVGNDDDALQARQPRRDLSHLLERVDFLSVVEVAVRREEHRGRDLTEAVEHALHPEIGGACREGRADARCGKHRRDRLGQVGQISGHPVSGLDAQRAQALRDSRDLLVDLAMREAALYLVFAPEHHRRGRVAPPQQVLGEVEPRLRIPARARHPLAVHEDPHALRARAHARELPQRVPELFGVLDRPTVEGRIVVESELPVADRLARETGEVRFFYALGARLPERSFWHRGLLLPWGAHYNLRADRAWSGSGEAWHASRCSMTWWW